MQSTQQDSEELERCLAIIKGAIEKSCDEENYSSRNFWVQRARNSSDEAKALARDLLSKGYGNHKDCIMEAYSRILRLNPNEKKALIHLTESYGIK